MKGRAVRVCFRRCAARCPWTRRPGCRLEYPTAPFIAINTLLWIFDRSVGLMAASIIDSDWDRLTAWHGV